MARAKQVAAGRRPENSPSLPLGTPKARPPSRPAPALRKKFRFLRKKSLRLLPAASLRGLARAFSQIRGGFGVQAGAVAALREGCEVHLLALLEEWGLCALHAGRSAVRRADVHLVRCLRVKRG